ncbi:MAG: hypothetical protein H6Q69_722 [Firmicutes bacterium]|nr:hypothetical protein [Bacillota bacterium]
MKSYKEIPIFIISFNRLNYLQQLISRLEKDDYTNIIILDNASTDQVLLKYLHSLPYKAHFFDNNYGHMVLWDCGLFNDIIENNYYVLTDPDILPIDECPSDYIKYFYDLLNRYPEYTKVGFSLKIDDLPETFKNKYVVIRWETLFYENILSQEPLLYEADIDTTFALYRPGYPKAFYKAIRTAFPYTAQHLSWYINSKKLPQEDNIYFDSAKLNNISSWFNDSGITNTRIQTIIKLIDQQRNIGFYNLNKRIIKLEWLNDISFRDILKTAFFLLSKKIRQKYKTLS